jgi:hypothetical protein
VAAVARPLAIREQVRAVAGLRWRILRNNLRKKNNRLDLIGLIATGTFASILVIGLSAAFYTGAYYFLSTGKAGWISFLFWGIFVFWQFFPVFAAGFGASFEFRTLLRFPLNLSAFYVIGLAYGLADFAAIASLCWLAAMIAGAAAAQPAVLPAMLLVGALFVFMNLTLERLVGSWLERLLSRRRTREIFFAIFILLMVFVQFIGPILNRYGDTAQPWLTRLLPYLAPLPASLAGRAIAGAAAHHGVDLFVGLGGVLLYTVLFSGLLWLRFAAQYRGEELSESIAPMQAIAHASRTVESKRDALDLLSPQVAAVVRKEFRYLVRNGFAALLLLLPPLFILLFTLQGRGSHRPAVDQDIPTGALFPGLMAYLILILMAPAYNSFAYEGRGIQTYFMAPVSFRNVFLGKNLVLVALIVVELAFSIAVFNYRARLPPLPLLLATLAAIVFTVVGQLTIANWSSLSFPRKLVFGQMRGQRQAGMAVLVAFGAQLLLGAISAVVFLSGRWTGDRWLPAEAFGFLAAATIGGYIASLDALTQLAEKKKENLIDALCR